MTDCREVFLVTARSMGGGACWSVIRERWLQLLYGFLPQRPVFGARTWPSVLFFVAMAPVLFSEAIARRCVDLHGDLPVS